MKAMGAISSALSLFGGHGLSFRNKESGKLKLLPGITSTNVEAISYKDALDRIGVLRSSLIKKLNSLHNNERSADQYLWLSSYILAISAQELMIGSMNDDLIASDVPWDKEADIPLISSTVGDAMSYAERLKDPKDHFLKALLLSFSGWTLLSTEKKECACNKGKLQEVSVDVLVNTNMARTKSLIKIGFFVGVQSDDPNHLESHYSFKEKSVRSEGLIIIHNSQGRMDKEGYVSFDFNQAEQFRSNRMVEILDGLISSFNDSNPVV